MIGRNKQTKGTIYLIDFGLCKDIEYKDGKILPV
jgi:hypothetical protein